MTDAPVTRDDQRERFELIVDGQPAFLTFRQEGDRITLVHTEVPEALEGRGLGARLVQTALDYVRTNDLTVVPHCAYVKSYLERHPEEARDLRVSSSDT